MMNPRLKFALQVTGFAASVVFLGLILYLIFFGRKPEVPITDIPEDIATGVISPSDVFVGDRIEEEEEIIDEVTGLPISPIARGGETVVTRLTTSAITGASSSGNDIAYYDPNDGQFYQIDAQGRVVAISNTAFVGADEVIFNPDADAAILEFPDGSNILFDIEQNKQITMPSHWEDFGFSPHGDALAGKAIADANNGQLVVMSTDGTQAQAVAELGSNEHKLDILWSPNNQFLGLSQTGQAQAGFGRNAVLLIDQNGDAPGSIIIDGTNFSAKWSPTGNHLAYSTSNPSNQERPSIWYVKASGDEIGAERRNLNVPTWIEKCTFRDDTFLICAVPREIEPFTGYSHEFSTAPDDIYEINVTTGQSKLLAVPSTDIIAEDLSVSADQSTLYFTDEFDRLNSIRLR